MLTNLIPPDAINCTDLRFSVWEPYVQKHLIWLEYWPLISRSFHICFSHQLINWPFPMLSTHKVLNVLKIQWCDSFTSRLFSIFIKMQIHTTVTQKKMISFCWNPIFIGAYESRNSLTKSSIVKDNTSVSRAICFWMKFPEIKRKAYGLSLL